MQQFVLHKMGAHAFIVIHTVWPKQNHYFQEVNKPQREHLRHPVCRHKITLPLFNRSLIIFPYCR